MPRFFLHIDNGVQRIEDEEGSELPDLAAARDEALNAARQLWAAAILDGRILELRGFLIANDTGEVVEFVDVWEALPRDLVDRLAP